MPCPNCDHTMSKLGVTEGTAPRPVWWCPRCGTSRFGDAGGSMTPMLVDRTRRFTDTLGMMWTALAHRLGIFESIYTPAERPKVDVL